jgi:hypothetical protein
MEGYIVQIAGDIAGASDDSKREEREIMCSKCEWIQIISRRLFSTFFVSSTDDHQEMGDHQGFEWFYSVEDRLLPLQNHR